MTQNNIPAAPECEKMVAVTEKSHAIGEFVDWLNDEKGIHLRIYVELDDDGTTRSRWVAQPQPMENLLAEYFGIDLKKVESERRAILEAIQ